MKTIQFSIPQPCHEDWDKMSPREKGRFCGNCSKTVIDFSSKTPFEIRDYFLEHQDEKLCGRFRNDQLKRPIRLEIPDLFYSKNLNSFQIFLLSLLIVFGTTLFSCTTHNNEKVGEIAIIDSVEMDSAVNSEICFIENKFTDHVQV